MTRAGGVRLALIVLALASACVAPKVDVSAGLALIPGYGPKQAPPGPQQTQPASKDPGLLGSAESQVPGSGASHTGTALPEATATPSPQTSATSPPPAKSALEVFCDNCRERCGLNMSCTESVFGDKICSCGGTPTSGTGK